MNQSSIKLHVCIFHLEILVKHHKEIKIGRESSNLFKETKRLGNICSSWAISYSKPSKKNGNYYGNKHCTSPRIKVHISLKREINLKSLLFGKIAHLCCKRIVRIRLQFYRNY